MLNRLMIFRIGKEHGPGSSQKALLRAENAVAQFVPDFGTSVTADLAYRKVNCSPSTRITWPGAVAKVPDTRSAVSSV